MKKAQLDYALPQGAPSPPVLTAWTQTVAHTLKLGWVEEIPRWQESSCWTGHPNYYQEHLPPRLEDDDRLRYHLELHMCVWLYHIELHMMIVVDII